MQIFDSPSRRERSCWTWRAPHGLGPLLFIALMGCSAENDGELTDSWGSGGSSNFSGSTGGAAAGGTVAAAGGADWGAGGVTDGVTGGASSGGGTGGGGSGGAAGGTFAGGASGGSDPGVATGGAGGEISNTGGDTGEVPTDGCGQPFAPTDPGQEVGWDTTMVRYDRTITVTHEDDDPEDSSVLDRQYWLVMPPDYDPNKAYALVFGIHGRGGDREQLRGYVNMEQPANGDAIFLYPEGLIRSQSDMATGWENSSSDSEDLSFMEALFEKYTSELCIDESRVFAYGHSWGGNMSNRMGCALSFIRGIGPIAGSGPRSFGPDVCVKSVPAMIIHNPLDGITDVDQGLGALEYWLTKNDCAGESSFETYVPGVPIEVSGDETEPPTLNSYLGCEPGFPVVWVEHHYTRNDNHNPPRWAPAVIWDFFSSL